MRFSKRPKFQTFQTSDTVIPTFPLNGAKVTKFSLSYTRNGYTWIDLPTVYEATLHPLNGRVPTVKGGRKNPADVWQMVVVERWVF